MQEVDVPEWVQAAVELQRGRGVTVVSTNRMLTTQEAADVLGVSRPTLVKVLERGDVRFTKVGRHRRVALGDLLEYREEQRRERLATLRDVASETPDAETFFGPSVAIRG